MSAWLDKLIPIQRNRSTAISTRVSEEVRLVHVVAGEVRRKMNLMGKAELDEKERDSVFGKAKEVIEAVRTNRNPDSDLVKYISVKLESISQLKSEVELPLEREMKRIVRKLPIHKWVDRPEQNGFGETSLAVVLGECGDLSNYANPAKVWRRMGCAPWTFDGETLMGSTWRSRKGKLPASEWESFGYSPRRRSICYNISECLIKGNFVTRNGVKAAGPYRARYLEAKEKCRVSHPEWFVCSKCDGLGRGAKGGKCQGCSGSGEVTMHAHNHGSLLAVKLLLKNLWAEWNNR